jgi:hypothetical protein
MSCLSVAGRRAASPVVGVPPQPLDRFHTDGISPNLDGGEKMLQAAEMKFMRKTAGLTLWDHKRNEEIFKKFETWTYF